MYISQFVYLSINQVDDSLVADKIKNTTSICSISRVSDPLVTPTSSNKISQSMYLSIYLSNYLTIYLTIYLSIRNQVKQSNSTTTTTTNHNNNNNNNNNNNTSSNDTKVNSTSKDIGDESDGPHRCLSI
jgi:hypothetical protein